MNTSTLRENIHAALAESSSQMPAELTHLKTLLAPTVKWADLTASLDSMCASREQQTCSGFKGEKDYVCYWISGKLPHAWEKPGKLTAQEKNSIVQLIAKTGIAVYTLAILQVACQFCVHSGILQTNRRYTSKLLHFLLEQTSINKVHLT